MVRCITSSLHFFLIGPISGARRSNIMKILEMYQKSPLGSIVDVLAETLGRGGAKDAAPGWLARLGTKLWRRQLPGADAYIARAESLSAALDRWLWKQRARQTEAWL